DVALEALELRPLDWALAEALAEGLQVQLSPGAKLRVRDAFARLESRLGRWPAELVPGADLLADVAPEDPIADLGVHPLLQPDASLLDGEVRDAAVGVEPVRRVAGAGRAGVEAACAGAAVVGREGRIGRKLDIHDEFADEE